MDLYCPRCREPWDNDCLHEEVTCRAQNGERTTYDKVAAEFRRKGCLALRDAYGVTERDCQKGAADDLVGEIYALLGDDMDGAASMLDDAMYMGLLD